MKGMARRLGAHSSGATEPGRCLVVCPLPVPPCRPRRGGVYCRGGRRLDPRVPSAADGAPGCGLGLRPHHIDEQKERFPPSSDRNGTLTLVTASAASQTWPGHPALW